MVSPARTSSNTEEPVTPAFPMATGCDKVSVRWETIFVARDLIDVGRKMCRLDLILVTRAIHQAQAAIAC